jgi:hypothetical protein
MSNQRNTKAPTQTLSSVSNPSRKKVNVQSNSNAVDVNDNINTKSIICDDFNKELLKHEINIEKWYHNLLIGKYFNKDGTNLCDDTILKRLSIEYQKAIRVKNIETMILIKNELMNHMPEQMFIHNFFMGEIYNQNKQQLNAISQDIIELSNEYRQVYQNAKQIID